MHYYLPVMTGHLIPTPLCAAQVVVLAEMVVTAGWPASCCRLKTGCRQRGMVGD